MDKSEFSLDPTLHVCRGVLTSVLILSTPALPGVLTQGEDRTRTKCDLLTWTEQTREETFTLEHRPHIKIQSVHFIKPADIGGRSHLARSACFTRFTSSNPTHPSRHYIPVSALCVLTQCDISEDRRKYLLSHTFDISSNTTSSSPLLWSPVKCHQFTTTCNVQCWILVT